MSGVLIMRDFVLRFGGGETMPGSNTWSLPDHTISELNATLSAGTFFGALLQAPLSDYLGRQRSMIVWALSFTIGAVIQTSTSTSIPQFVVGRVFAGLGVGALSGLCPLYLGETAPKAIRGMMVSGYQLLIIFGIFLSYGIGWASHNAEFSSASWRIPVGMQMLWGVLLIGLVTLLPESPRWNLQKGNLLKARETMASMRGFTLIDTPEGPRGDAALEDELAEMEQFISAEREAFAGTNYITAYAKCFSRDKQLWRRTLQGIAVQMFQQLNGQNFYYYYGPVFFQSAAVALDSYQIQFILGSVSLLATIPALVTVEKMGRRSSLLVGSVGCATCAFIVAFVGRYSLAPKGTPPDALTGAQKSAGGAFIAFAVIHLVFFSTFWGPVPWIYLSESFPQNTRAKCISLGAASNWFWNFMLSWFSPGLNSQYQTFILLIFGSVTYTAGVFVYFCLPEVKGLSLEQVDYMYESGAANKAWTTSKWIPPIGDTNRSTLGRGTKRVVGNVGNDTA
jgi:SP family sugar:H+ symporter-like MFS transporter